MNIWLHVSEKLTFLSLNRSPCSGFFKPYISCCCANQIMVHDVAQGLAMYCRPGHRKWGGQKMALPNPLEDCLEFFTYCFSLHLGGQYILIQLCLVEREAGGNVLSYKLRFLFLQKKKVYWDAESTLCHTTLMKSQDGNVHC